MAREKKDKKKEVTKSNINKNTVPDTLFSNETSMENTEDISEPIDLVITPDKTLVKNKQNRQQNNQALSLKFSFDKPVYLQIALENIYGIFSRALILPQRYTGDKSFPDVQSINPDVFLVSNGFIDSPTNTLLLEIILTKDETKNIDIIDNVGIIKFPLPISRVRRIYVENENLKNEILKTSLTNDGGLIPAKLLTVFSSEIRKINLPNNLQYDTLLENDRINLFDHILGTFAFLNNYDLLLSKKTNRIKTLPDHFLYALQAINSNPSFSIVNNERATNFYKQLFHVKAPENPIFKWFIKRLDEGANFHEEDVIKFANILAENLDSKDFLQEARPLLTSLNKSLERKNTIKNIPLLKDPDKFYLYLFAALRQYGNLNTEDRSISRADLPEFIHQPYGEYTFACLGYFYGYTTLRNFEEKPLTENNVFNYFLYDQRRQPIKLQIDDDINLYIIESVYQFVFNQKIVSENFLYLENNNQSIQSLLKLPETDDSTDIYTVSHINILSKYIYTVEKKTLVEQLRDALSKLGNDIPAISELGILCFSKKVPWYFGDFNKIFSNHSFIRYIVSFKKENLIDGLEKGLFNYGEVLKALENGFQNNEF